MSSVVFNHNLNGLYVCEAYPALFLFSRGEDTAPKDLDYAIKNEGCLIFCDTPPVNLDEFSLLVKEFHRDRDLKITWLQYPDLLDDPAKFRGLKIKNSKLLDRGIFKFRNHILYIEPGTEIEVNNDQLVLKTSPGKSITASFRTEYGAVKAGDIQGDIIIEAARTRPGRLKFNYIIYETDLNLLDAGIRFFFPDEKKGIGFVDSFRFPVFSPADHQMFLTVFLHPLYSLRRENEQPETIFQFHQEEPVSSYFRTPLGQTLWLSPGDGAGLVYERKMETLDGKDSDDWYLLPWGSFAIESQFSQFPSIMPGTSGTEFFQGGFDGQKFYMTFRNGCHAFLPGFKRDSNLTGGSQEGDSLSGSFTIENRASTSYVRFHGGLATYFAQPSEQPFYMAGGADDSASFLATPFANLTDCPPGSIPPVKECVPILPLGGIDPKISEMAMKLELRIAAPLRGEKMKYYQRDENNELKQIYTPIPVNTTGGVSFKNIGTNNASAEGITCVTPGGYIGEFSHDLSHWKRMIVTTGSDKKQFSINQLEGSLRNALLASRRITVISDPILFLENKAYFENTFLNISGWGFDLDPQLWLRYNTILVFKDHPESMEELIKRPDEWREGQYLNLDPWDVSEKILEAAAAAQKALDGGDLDFSPFVYQIWQNPNWNGFIAFNVPVSPVGFPDDLAVIAGGVDPSLLKAHHIGVSSSAIERQDTGAMTGGRGALFGLVNYNNDAGFGQNSSWDWTVRKLKARFRNSRLQSFQAQIDLCIRELFGDKASTTRKIIEKKTVGKKQENIETILGTDHQPLDTIELAGHYEEHDGKGRYSFISKDKVRFYVESGVLDDATLNRSSFETISVIKSEDGTKMDMKGRFLVSGDVKFQAQEDFDIFSYDKIPVKNIALNLSFEVIAKSKERPTSTMSFSIEPMRIQPDSAQSRTNALVNRFPLSLDSIKTLPENGLAALNLASVVSPISQSSKKKAGYQLEYKMDLGIGIKSFLTLVWWPDGKSAAIHMGLRIPGFNGDFSIVDDLIKLGPKQIQFIVNKSTGETILLFRRIALEFPLGISLPKDGIIDAALFGDPDNGGSGKVAWYAAWNKPK